MSEFNTANHELLAALATMLSTWDEATEKMMAFVKDPSAGPAQEYGACFPKMFDAATLARRVLATHRPVK